jgi:hypothetical protein
MLLTEDVRNTWEKIDGNDRDLVVERVLLMAGVNHPQVLKTQVLNGSMHGSCFAIIFARVVLPHWRGPKRAAIG